MDFKKFAVFWGETFKNCQPCDGLCGEVDSEGHTGGSGVIIYDIGRNMTNGAEMGKAPFGRPLYSEIER